MSQFERTEANLQAARTLATTGVKLSNGHVLPYVGIGTFGSDWLSPQKIAEIVSVALDEGYRHVDCAAVYGNQPEIGQVLKEKFQSGKLKREEVHITSKLWNSDHNCVRQACEKSLKELHLSYLDLYLVHWPFPNHHDPGVTVHSRDPNAKGFEVNEFVQNTWREMEKLVEDGLCKAIGVSNFTKHKLQQLLPLCKIRPAVNQYERHPFLQQQELFDFCQKEGIAVTGSAPLGAGDRPERDRTNDDPIVMASDVVKKIAAETGASVAQVILRWATQTGGIVVPKGINVEQIQDNLLSLNLTLSDHHLQELRSLDQHARLIKGQVFCWKDNQSWKELWDEL